MRFCSQFAFFGIFFFSSLVIAQLKSPKVVHPLAFMQQNPSGDTPGWFGSYWFEVEVSQANVWNLPVTLANLQNGYVFTYEADFEQTTYNLRNGFQLNEDFAFTVETPYIVRNGGFLDSTIDGVHQAIGSARFRRDEYPQGDSRFRLTENGQTVFDEGVVAGLSSVILGLKYWPLKWSNKGCPCGVGFGIDIGLPMDSAPRSFNSGGVNSTYSLHAGIPLGEDGGFWVTAALSYVPENKYFDHWPRKKYLQMYEGHLDIPLGAGVGVFLEGRVESPLMERDQLAFVDRYGSRYDYLVNRMSSGYNSLVYWRVYEVIGLRFRLGESSFLRLSILEDGALGQYDDTGDWMYVNNAPDVMGVLQFSVGF